MANNELSERFDVKRVTNGVADNLAKEGISWQSLIIIHDPP